MIDPLHLAAALDFLASSPAPSMTLGPATLERRRFMLEDTAGALDYFAQHSGRPTGPAQVAALEVFELAAAVWREYLFTFAGSFEPDTAALNLHAWASQQASTPEALPLPDAGTVAAWRAVCALAAMTAGPGFADGQPEDLLSAVLSSLEAGRMMN